MRTKIQFLLRYCMAVPNLLSDTALFLTVRQMPFSFF